jgi:hypothetical protein
MPKIHRIKSQAAAARLAGWFQRNGCARVPDNKRRRKEGQAYRKGYEVRLVARCKTELAEMRACLARMDFRPARPYRKGLQVVQPVYGKAAWQHFRDLVDRYPASRR